MRDALSFMRAVTKMKTFSSACVILVLAFPAEWPRSYSSHFFQQKPKGPEWGSRFPAALSRRRVEPSREKIVTVEERVSQFAYRRRSRTTPRRPSFVCGEQAKV